MVISKSLFKQCQIEYQISAFIRLFTFCFSIQSGKSVGKCWTKLLNASFVKVQIAGKGKEKHKLEDKRLVWQLRTARALLSG